MANGNAIPVSFSIGSNKYSLNYDASKKGKISGGNSNVILTRDGLYAVKFIDSLDNEEKYHRFCNEIEESKRISKKYSDSMIPILHSNTPSFEDQKNGRDVIYYVMPKCQTVPLPEEITELKDYVNLLIEAGESLLKIHESGHAHRDVKKKNVLQYEGTWRMSDYGCIFPYEGERISGENRKVGPKGCPQELEKIDPKLSKEESVTIFQKSDSFLFAKMIWHLFFKEPIFDGPFVHGDLNWIKFLKKVDERFPGQLFYPLVEIMENTILFDAADLNRRLSMNEIVDKLKAYKNLLNEQEESDEVSKLKAKQLMELSLMEPKDEYRVYTDTDFIIGYFKRIPDRTGWIVNDRVYIESDTERHFISNEKDVIQIGSEMERLFFRVAELRIYSKSNKVELLTKKGPIERRPSNNPAIRHMYIDSELTALLYFGDRNS